MANATVELQLRGVEQVAAQLSALHQQLESLGQVGSAGGANGVSSGSPGGTVGGANVATPTTNATTLSQAANNAGTQGTPALADTPPGDGAQPSVGAMLSAGMAVGIGYQAIQQVAGGMGQSIATGAPYQPQTLIPGSMHAAAAGLATMGPYGAIAAAALEAGAAVASPLVDKSIANEQLARTYEALYGSAPGMNFRIGGAQAMDSFARSGRPMSVEMGEYLGGRESRNPLGLWASQKNWVSPIGVANEIGSWFGVDIESQLRNHPNPISDWLYGSISQGLALPGREKDLMEAFNRAAYSPRALKTLGRVVSMDKDPNFDDFMDLAGAVGASDPSAVIGMGSNINRKQLTPFQQELVNRKLDEAADRMVSQAKNESAIEAYSGMLGYSQQLQQVGLQSGGQAGFRRHAGQARQDFEMMVAWMEREDAHETDPLRRAMNARRLQTMRSTFDFGQRQTDWQAGVNDFQSAAGLMVGRANRGFESALYGGQASLPFADQRNALMTQAQGIRNRARDGLAKGVVSPSQFNQMLNEAEALQQEATIGNPRREEQWKNSLTVLGGQERGQANVAGNLDLRIYGSAVDQAGVGFDRAAAAREEAASIRGTLKTSRYMTADERKRNEMRAQGLEMEAKQFEATAFWGQIQAGLQTSMLSSYEGMADEQIRLISGIGGMEAFRAKQEMVKRAQSNVAATEAAIAKATERFGADSSQVQSLRQQLAGQKIEAATQEAGMTLVPMTATQSIRLMDLETEKMAIRAGFAGGPGAIRANISAQMDTLKEHLRSLQEMEGAEMSGAAKVNLKRQINDTQRQLIGLQDEYDNGSFEMILSQSMNMGGGPGVTLAQAMYNRRTASGAGMDTLHHGGTAAWAQRMLGRGLRMMNVANANSPEGALRAAGSEGEKVIRIILEDGKGKIIGQANASFTDGQRNESILRAQTSVTD